MKVFAERLKGLREEKGLSQEKLAKLLGIAHGAISFWELGKRVPSFENAIIIAKFFNVSLEYLAGLED